jgi:hypothetical protein
MGLRQILMGTWLVLLSIAVVALVWDKAESKWKIATFHTIDARRINIVEPGGKYRLVIANTEHMPGNFLAGKEYDRPGGHRDGGMLFFNDEGDEVGGLAFGGGKTADGYQAGADLMFDQYKQDQTVGIEYDDRNGQRVAGFRVWDRPDYSILPLLEMNNRAAASKSAKARASIRQQMLAYANAHGGGGATRVFVGKQGKDAMVLLADDKGHPRLRLHVDGQGQASIEFLDEQGHVVRSISADAQATQH